MSKKVKIELIVDDKGSVVVKEFAGKSERAMHDTGEAVDRLGTKTSALAGHWKALGATMLTYFGAAQLQALASGFIDVASSFEQMEIKLDAITKGRGRETLKEINQWALTMPVNTRGAVDAFTMMAAMGLEPNIEKMQTLVDVSSIFGEEAMPRVARALGQIQTLGKLSAEELNQLAESGINARKYLTRAFGMTVEEIQKAEIAIEDVVAAIWKGLDEDFGGAAAAAQKTWRGLTTTLVSYWEEFERMVAEAGIFAKLEEDLADLVGTINELYEAGTLQKWAEDVSEDLEVLVEELEQIARLIAWISTGWKYLKPALRLMMAPEEGPLPFGEAPGKPPVSVYRAPMPEMPEVEVVGQRIEQDIKALERLAKEGEKLAEQEMKDLEVINEAWTQFYYKRYKDKIDAEEKANEEIKRLGEERLEDQRVFYERMQGATADWTYDLLDNQITSWSDAWDRIMDIVKHAIAEMVAYAISKPIIVPVMTSIAGALGFGSLLPGGLTGGASQMLSGAGQLSGLSKIGGALGLGGISQFLNSPMLTTSVAPELMGPAAPGIAGWGAASWGSVLGAGGLGYLGGSMLFPESKYSGIGGGIGATLGMMTPLGPLGAVIGGGVGSWIGSLFGKDKPHKFRAEIGWKGGEAYTRGWGRGEGMYAGVLGDIGEQIQATYGPQIAALEEMADIFGTNIPGFSFTTLVRSRDPKQAAERVMKELEEAFGKYTAGVAKKVGYDSAEEMMASFTQALTLSTQIGGSALEQAFRTGGGFDVFETQMRSGVYEAVKGGMIQAFIESSTYEQLMAPTMLAIEGAFAQATSGGDLNVKKFERLLTPILGGFESDLETLEPLFNAYQKVLSQTDLFLTGGSIPHYQHGTDYVPSKQLAWLDPGEAVLTAEQNAIIRAVISRAMVGGSTTTSEKAQLPSIAGRPVVQVVIHGSVVAEDLPAIINQGLEQMRLRKVGRTPAYVDLETVGLNIS